MIGQKLSNNEEYILQRKVVEQEHIMCGRVKTDDNEYDLVPYLLKQTTLPQ